MTLIISSVRDESWALQVTDRLLSITTGTPFDRLTNKSIIYLAKDAIVCLAYTGPAYVGSIPTDSWIAWKLCGPILDKWGTSGGVVIGQVQRLHIGQAVRLLQKELETSEIQSSEHDFALVIVGWKWKTNRRIPVGKRRPFPLAWTLRKDGANFKIECQEQPLRWSQTVLYSVAPDMPREDFRVMTDRLATLPNAGIHTAEYLTTFEDVIVDTIRGASQKNPYVGTNCMSILIAPPHRQRFVRVRFHPDKTYSAKDLGVESYAAKSPSSFSPWIIGPTNIWTPQIVMGAGWVVRVGPFEVHLDGQNYPEPGKLEVGFHDHIRPPSPRSEWKG